MIQGMTQFFMENYKLFVIGGIWLSNILLFLILISVVAIRHKNANGQKNTEEAPKKGDGASNDAGDLQGGSGAQEGETFPNRENTTGEAPKKGDGAPNDAGDLQGGSGAQEGETFPNRENTTGEAPKKGDGAPETEADYKIKEEIFNNVGKGIKSAIEAIASARTFIHCNFPDSADTIIPIINNIETTLLKPIPDFSPAENDKFDDISMQAGDSSYGSYVAGTIEPGKKLGRCVIKKANITRKNLKETD